jgi:hypothetical protein
LIAREPGAPSAQGYGLRATVAALSLVVLATSLLSPVRPDVTRERLRRLASAIAGEPNPRPERMGFWFDPDYLAFLDDLNRRVPKTATVSVLVPRRPDLYKYQASYQLAPRRVVEERWQDEADVVATYKTEIGRGPGGEPIAGGLLWTRRPDSR